MKCMRSLFVVITVLITVLAGGCATTPKQAETAAPVDPGVAAFAVLPDHRAAVANAALEGFRYRYGACPAASIVQSLPIQAPDRASLSFDQAGELIAGGVKEPVIVEGCGKASQENVVTLVVQGQRKTIAVTPGTTKGDLTLMHDTLPYLVMYTSARGMRSCRDQKVMNTRFEAFEGGPNSKAKFQADGGRPYWETWTVNACGTDFDIPVHYIPDELGTIIHVQID